QSERLLSPERCMANRGGLSSRPNNYLGLAERSSYGEIRLQAHPVHDPDDVHHLAAGIHRDPASARRLRLEDDRGDAEPAGHELDAAIRGSDARAVRAKRAGVGAVWQVDWQYRAAWRFRLFLPEQRAVATNHLGPARADGRDRAGKLPVLLGGCAADRNLFCGATV